MTEREQTIAEIRKAAKKSWWNIFDDARSIANAPEWLRFLLDELNRKDEENHKLREQRDAYYKSAQFAEAAAHGIEKLREENRKLIEGLRWYARKDTHEINRYDDGGYARITLDKGRRARDILHEIGVTVR